MGVGVGADQLSWSSPRRADVSWVPGGGHLHGTAGCLALRAEEFLRVAGGSWGEAEGSLVLGIGRALELRDLMNLRAAPGGSTPPDSASSLIPSSGGYGHLAGAVLPPVPAALRWDADVQPPVGLHRVAHHPGGPAWLWPFRLLAHSILFAWKGSRCLRVGKAEGHAGLCLCMTHTALPSLLALLLNSLHPGLQ